MAATHLAIDYGTTNTVATVRRDSLERIKFGDDWRLPSAVFWDAPRPLVGVAAHRSARMEPTRFIRCPKREMGHENVPLTGRLVPVVDVVAAVFDEVRSEVHRQLGRAPDHVVCTLPAQWGAHRRGLFEQAVEAGGFRGAEFLEEPVAAAVRVGMLGGVPEDRPFAVLDFGGGTLDVAVLVRTTTGFDVLASDGVDPLGGEDLDDQLFSLAVDALGNSPDAARLRNSMDAMWARNRIDLRNNCRRAKEHLSEAMLGTIDYPGNAHRELTLTRPQFDAIADGVLTRVVATLRDTVRQAGDPPSQVPVYLVGGSSRLPSLAHRIGLELGATVRTLGDAQFVVSEGAALWAAGLPGTRRGRMVYLQGADALRDYRARLGDLAQRAQQRVSEVVNDPSQVVDQARELQQRTVRALQDVSERTQGAARAAQSSGSVPVWVWLCLAILVLLLLVMVAG